MAVSPDSQHCEEIQYINVQLTDSVEAVQFENGEIAASGDVQTIFLQDGQYAVPLGTHAVLLQNDEGVFEYVVNDLVVDELPEGDEVVQPQICYVNEDGQPIEEVVPLQQDFFYEETDDNVAKRIKLEYQQPEMVETEVESFVQVQEELDCDVEEQDTEADLHPAHYQYAILKDGKLHLQTLDVVDNQLVLHENEENQELQEQLDAFQESINLEEGEGAVNLDKITGKNLITGQTVTLESYFEKLQRRLASFDVNDAYKRRREDDAYRKTDSSRLMNKKIMVGKTANGKRIFGKIVKVHVNEAGSDSKSVDQPRNEAIEPDAVQTEEEAQVLSSPVKQELMNPPQIIIKKHLVSRENFDDSIGKTLAGLMDLDSVHQKLASKNLMVKLIEKCYDSESDSFSRNVSYVYGHMEVDTVNSQQWRFVLHNDTDSEIVSRLKNPDAPSYETPDMKPAVDEAKVSEDKDSLSEDTKPNEIVSLTVIITIDKNGRKSTRVNLSSQHSNNRCYVCNKDFKTNLLLRKHINNVHFSKSPGLVADTEILQRHKKAQCDKLFQCVKCAKMFNTASSLKRHFTIHDPSLRRLQCLVCVQRFTDESSLRKHLLIHSGIRAHTCEVCARSFISQGDLNCHRRIHDSVKQFSCEVCGREFSRHSNLMRHAEIHRGKALHRCDLCGCSYSFISSLTRHYVEKHVPQKRQ